MRNILSILLFTLLAGTSYAHSPSVAYLSFDKQEDQSYQGRLDISPIDLEASVGLDLNQDSKITWQEIKDAELNITNHLGGLLSVTSGNESCSLNYETVALNKKSDGLFVSTPFNVNCPAEGRLAIDYNFLFDLNSQHKAIVSVNSSESTNTFILDYEQRDITIDTESTDVLLTVKHYFSEGLHHIWFGFDHLLFLFTLLIVSLSASGNKSTPRKTIWKVAGIVTAFSLAHSVTLCLTVLDVISLSGSIVEPVIAFSIVVAALAHFSKWARANLWLLAAIFGLIHGMGFAGALGDLGLPASATFWALLAFNLGVEIGQLAIVFVVLPLLLLVQKTSLLKPMQYAGIAFVTFVGSFWFIERVAGF